MPMLRRRVAKFLPSHQSVRDNRYVAIFGSWLKHHNLWHLHRRSVAGGVAIGLFCGLLPAPFQMLSAAVSAVLLRMNLPVAVFATLYTNPLTMLPLYYLAYRIGRLATGQSAEQMLAMQLDLRLDNIGEWLPMLGAWLQAMGWSFALGLLILASSLAIIGYTLVRAGWRCYVVTAWRKRLTRRTHTRAA